jgi:hypothetical protein
LAARARADRGNGEDKAGGETAQAAVAGVALAGLHVRAACAEPPELRVIAPNELLARLGVVGVDATHVLIETSSIGLTGYQADDWLREQRRIDLAITDLPRIMSLVSFAHGEQAIDRLVKALRDLVSSTRRESQAPEPE